MFAESCVFDKQSLEPIHCGLPERELRKAPLIANLRGQFAEFLNHRSPERLRLLVSPTCVSFSTAGLIQRLEAFLGGVAQSLVALRHRHHVSDSGCGFAYTLQRPTRLAPQSDKRLTYHTASLHRSI